jgi:hypothetical protein
MREIPLYTYISTGDKTAMYTLRERVDVVTIHGTIPKDRFIAILSNSYDKALSKAVELTMSLPYSIPLKANQFELNDREKLSESISSFKDTEIVEDYDLIQDKKFEVDVVSGVLLVGKYSNHTIEEVAKNDPDYLYYVSSAWDEPVKHSARAVTYAIIKKWVDANPKEESFFGVVGEKYVSNVVLKKKSMIQGVYGLSYALNFETSTGQRLVTYTTAKKFVELEVGSELSMEFLVHSHDDRSVGKVTTIKKGKIV